MRYDLRGLAKVQPTSQRAGRRLGTRDIEPEQSDDAPVLLNKLDGTLKVVDEGDWSSVPDGARETSQRLAEQVTKFGVDVVTHPELLEQLGVTGILAPIDGERLSVVETLDRVPGLGGDLFGEGVARGLELFGVSEVDAVIFGKVGGFVVSILLGRMVAPLALAAEGISVALVIVTGGDLQTAIVRRLIVRTVLSTL